jgi:hypothetical protein
MPWLPSVLPWRRGPRLDAKSLAGALRALAREGPRVPGPRRLLMASADFFSAREPGAYEEAHRSLRSAYDLAREGLSAKLGPPEREVASPGWFKDALMVSEWSYERRVAWLALHQDEVDLPFMLSLGLRG